MEDSYNLVGKATGFRFPGVRSLRIPVVMPKPRTTLSSALFLVCGFATLICAGAILLMMPISSNSGVFTSPVNALFTAASAVSVTGLVVVDTGTYWSTFGQAVLLVLFQIGGLGFITATTLILLAMGKGLGLRERLVLRDSVGLAYPGGVFGLVLRITIFALVVEALGVLIFYLHFESSGFPGPVLWTSVFHAISSFNNCGMDIFGGYKSLAGFSGDTVVLLTTAFLVIVGSTGYLVFEDILRNRSFTRLSLESKLVLVFSGSLLLIGTLFYFAIEFSNPATLADMGFGQKLLVAFFQAVTPRTAGFSAIDVGGFRETSLFFTLGLMLIGGAAGSSAGGIKVNTFGLLIMTAISSLRGKEHPAAFNREFNEQNVYRSLTLLICYVSVAAFVIVLLTLTESFNMDKLFFEAFSALGTVGLSTGITPALSVAGRLIITVAMFVGRLGPPIMVAFLVQRQQPDKSGYPHENVRIG